MATRRDARVPDNDLLPLLRKRLLGTYSPLLADTTASLLFTAGGMANWTVEIDRGRAMAKRGGPANPTTTVHASLRVLDDVAGRLAQARSDVGQQSTSTVAQRVATTLLRLADKLGQERSGNRGTLLQLPLSRADLAGMVGSTEESVSRVMSRLRKDGIIDSGRRWTAVLDRDRLSATAEVDG